MADYRREATGVRSDLVASIASLTRPTEVTVASMVQAPAFRRANNLFFLRALLVLLTGTFRLSRCRPWQHGMLRKR